jgi:hypothetical protein
MGAINYSGMIEMTDKAYRESSKGDYVDVAGLLGNLPDNYRITPLQGLQLKKISEKLDVIWNTFPVGTAEADYNDNWDLNRVLFENATGGDLTVVEGGVRFNLRDGYAFACHPSEWLLFSEQQPGLTKCDFNTWWNLGDSSLYTFLF